MFVRDLAAGYRQSWLGYLWLILPPLATTAIWTYLHSARILHIGATEIPYPLYVVTGTLLWQVFVDSLNSPLQQLNAARTILTKSRMPHEAWILAGLLDVLFKFTIRTLVLFPVLLWFGVGRNTGVFLVPLGVAALLLFGSSLGLLLTPAGLLYQDISRGLGLLANFWFYLTPVVYPVPENWPARQLASLNPVTPLLVSARDWLTLGLTTPAGGFLQINLVSALCWFLAWMLYRLARPHVFARL